MKTRMTWDQSWKEIGSMFVGTSPEFEFAINTVCAFARPAGLCSFNLGATNVRIQTRPMADGERYILSTAYLDH